MSLIKHKLAAATAVAAAFSLAATPAWAVELPRVAGQGQAWDADALNAERGGRHGHRGHHGDDWDIDGDDVLAGVLILGGIAAIAGIANSGRNRQQSYPEPEPYPDDAGYRGVADAPWRGGGMAEAVDRCVAEVEAGTGAVGSVDSANRVGAGWRVSGELADGAGYWCTIDGAGQVSVGGSGTAYAEPVAGEQYDDAYYASARAAKAQVDADVDGDLGEDGRYEVAQAGD